jgi:GMP synthase-like glutamine amidotransferase
VIVYVDLEHDRLRQYPDQWEKSLARRLKHKYRFEELTGDLCLIVRYQRISPALLRDLKARAVLVSGCATDFEYYTEAELAGLRAVYREADWPTLGFCGGMQLMAQAHGASIDAMDHEPEAPAPRPYAESNYQTGMRHERGFMPVRVTQPHALVAGLSDRPVVFQAHYWEVKSVPAGFQVLAESDVCRRQILIHNQRPLFGTQFHPEEYDDAHPDGRQIIENFFRIAGVR